jgi:hypothetical protein
MTEKFNKIRLAFFLLLCCGIIFTGSGCKQKQADKEETRFEIEKQYQRGPLKAYIRIDKTKINIAQTINLQLQAVMEPGYKVTMPTVEKVLENFGIVDWDNLGDKLDPNNNVVTTYQYRLEPFLSGTYPIPAFTFEFHDVNSPDQKQYSLETEPVDVNVTSLLGEQRSELKINEIQGVVEIPAKTSYLWIWILCVIAIVGGAGILFYIRHKGKKEIVRIFKSAHEIAYERLRTLVEQDLVGAGKIKEFYEQISDILRHYIEHRFNIHAPERTTEEFLAELPSANLLNQSDQNLLAEFLTHCDLVKFAKYNPTTEQIQKTFDLVKNFIETTKSQENKIDVTKAAGEKSFDLGSI